MDLEEIVKARPKVVAKHRITGNVLATLDFTQQDSPVFGSNELIYREQALDILMSWLTNTYNLWSISVEFLGVGEYQEDE